MQIYLDLHGVLFDFREQVKKTTGYRLAPDEWTLPLEVEKLIDNPGFWSTMPVIQSGLELVNEIAKYNPSILTAPFVKANGDLMESSISGTRKLIRQTPAIANFPAIHEREKERFAHPDTLLIDDNPLHIRKFVAAGGSAFLWEVNSDKFFCDFDIGRIINYVEDFWETPVKRPA